MDWTAVVVVPTVFLGVPWLFLHYSSQWRKAKGISIEDENLLDDLHDTARRLDARLDSIERIIAADNPGWKDGVLAQRQPADRIDVTASARTSDYANRG